MVKAGHSGSRNALVPVMSILDAESIADYQILSVIGVVMTLVTLGVLLSDLRPGLIVLSAPIAIGALVLAVRSYLTTADQQPKQPDQL